MNYAGSLVGQQIDQYYVEALIARGGMSLVFRARDMELDPLWWLIKLIGIDTEAEPIFAERLEREARTVAQLRHPNIVGIYHKGIYDALSYLVIEFINGPTLEQILKGVFMQGGRMDYRAVMTIVGSVTSALDHAHRHGVIHRDIKPSNIMADLMGMVYLTDFGLALRMIDGTEGKAFGSPYYISPEQINSSGDVSPRSDFYSLGIVAYRLLTGRLPFEAETPMYVVMKHLSDEPALPSSLNPALSSDVDEVFMRVLAKNPRDRYETGVEFQQALADALALPEMGQPIFQPQFLAPTWTRVKMDTGDLSASAATWLLDDLQD